MTEKEAEHRKIAPWSDVEFESFRAGHYAECTAPGDDRYCRVCGLLNMVLDLKERAA